jgi:hypothetical protein
MLSNENLDVILRRQTLQRSIDQSTRLAESRQIRRALLRMLTQERRSRLLRYLESSGPSESSSPSNETEF